MRARRRRRRALAIAALALAPPLWLLVAGALAYHSVALAVPARLPAETRAAIVAPLRAVVDGGAPVGPAPGAPGLARAMPGTGPIVVSLWSRGRRVVRVEGRGLSIGHAAADAARALAEAPGLARLDAAARRAARLQVDVVVARGPLHTRWKLTSALGAVAGLDGVGARIGHREVVLMPDELVERRLWDAITPIPLAKEIAVGLELDAADAELAVRAALPAGEWGAAPRTYFRVRTDSFVERPAGQREAAPLPLVRGRPPAPEVTAASLREAAVLGGEYLMAHLGADGRYAYTVDLTTGVATDPAAPGTPYSLPRHAGTTYYLGELLAATGDARVREAVERALAHLVQLIGEGDCQGISPGGRPYRCVVDKGKTTTNLGSTALAVVAFAEYRLATGDPRHDETLAALVEWILMLRKENRLFAHKYDVPTGTVDWQTSLPYFDGEAALALLRAYEIFGDERLLRAAEGALDALIEPYDRFVMQFFFGEEHWTCIAAEAAWPHLKHDRYREFCSDYAAYLREQQFAAGEPPGQEDYAGAYSVTPFFVPANTPAGSRTEAMISAWLLTRHHGRPDERIRRQVLATTGYLLGQLVRPDSDWNTPADAVHGAMPSSAIDPHVRIDYVQHTCSAMLRAIDLIQAEGS